MLTDAVEPSWLPLADRQWRLVFHGIVEMTEMQPERERAPKQRGKASIAQRSGRISGKDVWAIA